MGRYMGMVSSLWVLITTQFLCACLWLQQLTFVSNLKYFSFYCSRLMGTIIGMLCSLWVLITTQFLYATADYFVKFEIFLLLLFQTNGKCYGDALFLMSPHNDTISLCGHRDGLALKLTGYRERLVIAFKSLEKSSFNGFSCRIKMEVENKVFEADIIEDDGKAFKGMTPQARWLKALSLECSKMKLGNLRI